MEFSFDQPRDRVSSGTHEQSLGTDRLKKAIERNRAKQAKRSSRPQPSMATQSASPRQSAPNNDWQLPPSSPRKKMSRTAAAAASARRSVGKADEQEFTAELRKGNSKAPANVNYESAPVSSASVPAVAKKKRAPAKKVAVKTLGPKTKKKTKSKAKKNGQTNEYIVKGVWVFCAFLFIRLIFSGGGIQDFYQKKDVLQSRFDKQEMIEKENTELIKEIELLRKNAHYQKKVVRDHLGYIASDEYLILFPEG